MSSPQPATAPAPDPQAAQAGLAILVGLAVVKLWPSLDLLHLRSSLPAFKAAVAQEVRRHAQASATLAARQYRQQRVAAGAGSGFTPVPADPPGVQQIAQAVDWAVQPLWDTAVPVALFPDAPAETREVAGSAIADAKARLAAATEKQALSAGWDTITSNTERDRRATGWALIPEPGACYFCALLASRGAVFKNGSDSFSQANRRTGVKFLPHADFPDANAKVHDHCRCHVEPVFNSYEPSARVREWQGMYERTARDVRYGSDANVSAADMRRAFRQAYEGRPIDIGKSGQSPSKPRASTKPSVPAGRSQEQVRAELAALEKNVSRLTTDQQREWTSKRIDALRQQLDQQ